MIGEIGEAKVLVAWNANGGGPTSVGGTCKFLFREVRLGSSSLREPWSGSFGLLKGVTHALQHCSHREAATGTNTYIHTFGPMGARFGHLAAWLALDSSPLIGPSQTSPR